MRLKNQYEVYRSDMKFCMILTVLLLLNASLQGFNYSLRNQLVLHNTGYLQGEGDTYAIAGFWQPELNLSHDLSGDFSSALNFNYKLKGEKTFGDGGKSSSLSGKIHGLWLKAGTSMTDVRAGLQRINFGSAQILRPLQWFDNLDPTDRLEQTEGVQALLVRHYFLNNANVWLWGIRGDGKPRGEMQIATKKGTPELGGRIQLPTSNGAFAFSFTRSPITTLNGVNSGLTGKLGFDIKLDYSFGLWLEGQISFTEPIEGIMGKHQTPVTLGIDYTWSVGNGIYTLMEARYWADLESWTTTPNREGMDYAFTANYPLGLLDTVSYYGVVKDDSSASVHTIIWRRIYDRLSWDVSAFWDAGKLHRLYNSRGIKLMLAYIL